MFLFTKIAFQRVSDTLVERETRIEGRSEEALKLESEAESLRQKIEFELQNTRREASELFEGERRRALQEQRLVISKARESASAEIQRATSDLNQQLNDELKKLEAEVPRLAQLFLENISKEAAEGKSKRALAESEVN